MTFAVRRVWRTPFLVTAALMAAVTAYVVLTLPNGPIDLPHSVPSTDVLGAYHVHTRRSDGSGTNDEIAAAAARAGLAFVIFTDHGDATREPDPPAYRHGVLCIDAVEVSTDAGHVVALGLTNAAPYPLGGQAQDVVDDIHRMGGLAVVAHPDSPKADLRWRAQNVSFDGIEWLNADSEWRDETTPHLMATAVRSLLRGPAVIASLFSRPARSLARWDTAARQRPVFALAALDAHARIPWRDDQQSTGGAAIAQPSYETMFRTLGQIVVLPQGLSHDAARDASAVLQAIEQGHSFSIVRALADPAELTFVAEQNGATVAMGDRLPAAGATMFEARVPQAPGAHLTLLRDGRPVAAGQGSLRHMESMAAGVYRVEASIGGASVPWLASNAIVVGPPVATVPASPAAPADSHEVLLDSSAGGWDVEHDASSVGRTTSDSGGRLLEFRLGGGLPHGQYAALVTPVSSGGGVDLIRFKARAMRPMRLSVQVRLASGRVAGQRWRESVFVDETSRAITLRLADFEAADGPPSPHPVAAPIQSLLFVVDTVNAKPASDGRFWISDVSLGVALGP